MLEERPSLRSIRSLGSLPNIIAYSESPVDSFLVQLYACTRGATCERQFSFLILKCPEEIQQSLIESLTLSITLRMVRAALTLLDVQQLTHLLYDRGLKISSLVCMKVLWKTIMYEHILPECLGHSCCLLVPSGCSKCIPSEMIRDDQHVPGITCIRFNLQEVHAQQFHRSGCHNEHQGCCHECTSLPCDTPLTS